MRIRKLRWKNFKNYKDEGFMDFPETGIVNIIYGNNGDGKSNLHQLFRWILYGTTHFNKTDSNKIYNLNYEHDFPEGNVLEVMGEIEFEHQGKEYCLTRTAQFLPNSKKEFDEIGSDIDLKYLEDYNWKKIDTKMAADFIEDILPEYLSDYFLFDGEKMIADLNLKSKDSAKKLKEMLFHIFNLDIIQLALNDLGTLKTKKSVLGKLYLQKASASSDDDVKKIQLEYSDYCSKLDFTKNKLDKAEEKLKELEKEKDKISEEIGSKKSKGELEKNRKILLHDLEELEKDEIYFQSLFGEKLNSVYLEGLTAKRVLESGIDYSSEVFQEELPEGLSKTLIEFLTREENHNCICGKPLTNTDKEKIKGYLRLLPPLSYQESFDQLKRNSARIVEHFTKDQVDSTYNKYLNKLDNSYQKRQEIDRLDQKMKSMDDIEDLVEKRLDFEQQIQNLQKLISTETVKKRSLEAGVEKKRKAIDEITAQLEICQSFQRKIDIVEKVVAKLEQRLDEEGKKYSTSLQNYMQSLLDQMLHSKRYVTVSPDFTVSIRDQHGDESKSEGQFAVASFAYIGGILKLLEEEQNLSSKSFPLILDGPFSKLDDQVRSNVAKVLPDIVPQMIIFSKDDLSEVFSEDYIGSVYSIKSQNAQTEAKIIKGITGTFNGN